MLPSPAPAAPPEVVAPWGPSTSGPFLTGTAEVVPFGSALFESYAFDYDSPGGHAVKLIQRASVGLGSHFDLNASFPFVVNGGGGQEAGGVGDAAVWVKYQLLSDSNTRSLLARPAVSLEAMLIAPTGRASRLDPELNGLDQTGAGSLQESLVLVVRKRFAPFVLYLQAGASAQNPFEADAGYAFGNGAVATAPGHVVSGDLLSYSIAFEHVLDDTLGIGYLVELSGATQLDRSLFFGPANAPPWSALWIAPEVELTYPNVRALSVTWGVGVMYPLLESGYPRDYVPEATITVNFNGPKGHR